MHSTSNGTHLVSSVSDPTPVVLQSYSLLFTDTRLNVQHRWNITHGTKLKGGTKAGGVFAYCKTSSKFVTLFIWFICNCSHFSHDSQSNRPRTGKEPVG